MFPAAAIRINQILQAVEFSIVVNIGSSTKAFFQGKQPYIWNDLMKPLLDRGNALFNVDRKKRPGVHLVGNAESWCSQDFADIVLCCNILEHTLEPRRVLENAWRTLKPAGLLVMEGPADYPYHPDPIDTMLRPKTGEEWDELLGLDRWTRESFEIITWDKHPGQTASLVVYRKKS